MTTLTGIEGPHNLQVSPDGKNVWAVSGHDAMAVMVEVETAPERTASSSIHPAATPT